VEAGRASTGRPKRCKTIWHVSRLLQPALLAAALLLASPGPVLACRDFAQAPGSRWRLASRQGVAWLVTQTALGGYLLLFQLRPLWSSAPDKASGDPRGPAPTVGVVIHGD